MRKLYIPRLTGSIVFQMRSSGRYGEPGRHGGPGRYIEPEWFGLQTLENLGTGEGLYEVRFLGNQIILFRFSIFRKIPTSLFWDKYLYVHVEMLTLIHALLRYARYGF